MVQNGAGNFGGLLIPKPGPDFQAGQTEISDFQGHIWAPNQLLGVELSPVLTSGAGRSIKSGGAYAPLAPPRWAPLQIAHQLGITT